MKVNTNLKSGNFLNDIARKGCQGLYSTASFFDNANRAAEDLISNTTSGFQSAWNIVMDWISRS